MRADPGGSIAVLLTGGPVLVAILALSLAAWGAAAWAWLALRRRGRGDARPRQASSAAEPGARPAVEPSVRGALAFVAQAAVAATLLGLLGTVLGMMDAFEALGGEPALRMDRLASGVAGALTTTQAGLVVAIPLYVAHAALHACFTRALRRARRT